MKKFLLISGLAVAAMVSCTKNEVYVSENNDAQISFKPLSATQTKSTPIKAYETTTGDFNVYAWYQEGTAADATFTPTDESSYTVYMNNVTCSYAAGNKDDGAGRGTWEPSSVYFWPKNGKLTFSAYYPTTLSGVTVDAKTGIKIADYEIGEITDQVDVLYSSRVFDRVSSTETDDNKTYDGVDIVFNHALSAASFYVKTAKDYGADAVKLYSIQILQASSKGTFAEGYTKGLKSENPKAEWTVSTPIDYTVTDTEISLTDGDNVKAGVDCIMLPQTFSDDIAIKVTYGIKYVDGTDTKYLKQVATFPLKNTTTNNGTKIEAWEMGKWYKYTLTFTLDTVYFAPSVSNWDEVTVDGLEVK